MCLRICLFHPIIAEALKGERKGQYSIRINRQWRICFCWENDKVFDVEIVDYH